MFKIQIHATGSKGNAYSICDGDHKILIDPGIRFKELQKKTGFSLSSYDLCLLSHEHKDHSRAIKDVSKLGVYCAMSEGTAKVAADQVYWYKLKYNSESNLHNWKILPFKIEHDAAEPMGFLIGSPSGKKIVFATDTAAINSNFKGVTHWLVEANFSEALLAESDRPEAIKDRIRASHMSIENLCEFFKRQDLIATEEIYLIHLSDDNSDAKCYVEEIEALTGKPVYLHD